MTINRCILKWAKPQNAFENLLRAPYEFLVATFAFSIGSVLIMAHQAVSLTMLGGCFLGSLCFALAYLRFLQGWEIFIYQRSLLKPRPFAMNIKNLPHSPEVLYFGMGFQWKLIHRQRLQLLSMVENARYLEPGFLRPTLKNDIGGKPWLHGVGAEAEKSLFLSQSIRNSHILVAGMTRVGKTRLMSILVCQDILNGEAVTIIDPKGDQELLQDLYLACRAVGRLEDLMILHAGYPDISAKYNPLASFSNVSEVATRVASAISASGEGKQFQDFSWKFLNITAACIHEMGMKLSYKTLSFYVARPKQTLLAYCDRILPKIDPHYFDDIEAILDEFKKVDEEGQALEIPRSKAVNIYLQRYIEEATTKGEASSISSTITDLHHAANVGDEFYGKITASLGPVFDKINKTSVKDIFSWDFNFGLPVVELEAVVKRKKILYVGLDAMVNKAMAEAVGQAMISDFVSLAGRLYKESGAGQQKASLCIHVDEFAEVVREEFITLLNKAGGVGFKITAYTQTVNDIAATFGSNKDKAEMIMGNFGTKIMLRVANEDTARVMTNAVEEVTTRNSTPSTMSNDKADGSGGELFTSYNTDAMSDSAQHIIVENDLTSLPKGQAFILTNGGEIYKVRIPLPQNDGTAPMSIAAMMSEVNL